MAENPYISGQFYEGEYITGDSTDQLLFRDPIRDERIAFLLEISGSHEFTFFALKRASKTGTTWFYHINAGGTLSKTTTEPTFGGGFVGWYLTSAHTPAYLVFVDENSDVRYVSYDTDATGNLIASATPPPNTRLAQAQYAGLFLDILSTTGTQTYRMTVNSSNVITFTLNKFDPFRNQLVCLSQGMDGVFSNGRQYIEAIRNISDIEMLVEEVEWGYGGVVVPRSGTIEIELGGRDIDGSDTYELDWLTSQKWDTREVTIRSGLTTTDPNLWPIIYRSQTQNADWDEDILTITLRDYGTILDRNIQNNTYTGTGLTQGTVELIGQIKPLAYGDCRHVTPVLIDPINWVYQVHDGQIDRYIAIYDRGVIRPFSTGGVDIEDHGIANLWLWQPTAAQSAHVLGDKSRGLFRLAGPPDGIVTCTFSAGGQSTRTIATIVQAIIQKYAPEIEIDQNSFDEYAQRVTELVNIFINEPRTIRDILHELTSTTGGIIGINRVGQLFIRQLERRVPKAHITSLDMRDDQRLKRISPPKPARSYRGGVARVYTTLSGEELAVSAHPSARMFVSQEYRYLQHNMALPFNRYNSASSIEIKTPFDSDSQLDAGFWVQLISARQHTNRHLYEVPIEGYMFQFEIGDSIILQYPRFDLYQPRDGMIVGIYERINDQTTMLLVWI